MFDVGTAAYGVDAAQMLAFAGCAADSQLFAFAFVGLEVAGASKQGCGVVRTNHLVVLSKIEQHPSSDVEIESLLR